MASVEGECSWPVVVEELVWSREGVMSSVCLQVLQGGKEKAMEDARVAQEQSTMLWKKLEEIKREKADIQKKLDQKQKGQVC